MKERNEMYCNKCNSEVINDCPGWLACYCTSREINGDEPFPGSWICEDAEPSVYTGEGGGEGPQPPFESRQDKVKDGAW